MDIVEKQWRDLYLFLQKLFILLPLFALIPIINFLSFPVGKERICAEQLLKGRTLYGDDAPFSQPLMDERLFQKFVIEGFATTKHVVIFGSSRSGQISLTPYLNRYASFFNNNVNMADLNDVMVMYGMYKKKNSSLPAVIIVECSPWWLNKNYKAPGLWVTDDAWVTKVISKIYQVYKVCSIGLLQIALKKNLQKIFGKQKDVNVPGARLLPDGQRIYPKSPNDKVLQSVLSLSQYSNIEKFNELNRKAMVEFEGFVKQLLNDGIRVLFFLPPYHPVAYKRLRANQIYDKVFEAQEFFIGCAQNFSIEVVGSYDPEACGCEASDFSDWYHLYEISTEKIFKNVLGSL